jgi:hypothetical protein
MVEKAFNANKDGGGIAWREDKKVRWAKGLDLEDIQEFCKTAPLPYVAHFRIASAGGVNPALCHPFPIDATVSLLLEGVFDGPVLFHNGHWTTWRSETRQTVRLKNLIYPAGKWSDTRAMAFEAFHYGLNALEMIDEKCVAFGPNDITIFGKPWDSENGVLCSNLGWKHIYNHHHNHDNYAGYMGYQREMCADRQCTKTKMIGSIYCQEHQPRGPLVRITDPKTDKHDGAGSGGASPEETFCNSREAVSDGGIESKAVQESKTEVREGDIEAEADELAISALATREDLETLKWVRALNPKRIRSHTHLPVC